MNTYYNRDSEKRRNSSVVSRPSPMPTYMNTNSTRFQSTSRDPLTSSRQSVRLRGRHPTNNEITGGPITKQTVDMLNERTRNLRAQLAKIEERGRVQEEERRKAEEQERVAQEQEKEWVARNEILGMQQQRERAAQYEILHMRQQERERAAELETLAKAERKEIIMNQEEKTRSMIEKNRQLMNQEMSRTGTAILEKLRAVKEQERIAQERAEEQERILREQEILRLEIERVRAEEQERLRIAQERVRAEEQERLRIAQERLRIAQERERLRIAQERERLRIAQEQERLRLAIERDRPQIRRIDQEIQYIRLLQTCADINDADVSTTISYSCDKTNLRGEPICCKFNDINKEEAEQCGICFDNKSKKSNVQLACGHIFHAACLLKMDINKNLCPLCRDKIYEIVEQES